MIIYCTQRLNKLRPGLVFPCYCGCGLIFTLIEQAETITFDDRETWLVDALQPSGKISRIRTMILTPQHPDFKLHDNRM